MYHGVDAHAAQVSADVVLEFSAAAPPGQVTSRPVSAARMSQSSSGEAQSQARDGAHAAAQCVAHPAAGLLEHVKDCVSACSAGPTSRWRHRTEDVETSAGVRLAVLAAGEAMHSCALMLLVPGAYQVFGTGIRCHWGPRSDRRGAEAPEDAVCLYPLHIFVTSRRPDDPLAGA